MRARSTGLFVSAALALTCLAQNAAVAQPAGGPPGQRHAQAAPASSDPSAAAGGVYVMDTDHASIIARILHEGTSYSTFRFYSDTGTLNWNPDRIEASKVDVSVETKSIATPVVGFADRLTGAHYLNSGQFPQARFVSTAIRRTGRTTGEITGDLTLLGVTKPITVQAELVGVGSNAKGRPTIGFKGAAKFKRSDFGLTILLPAIGDDVELDLDMEFNRQG